MLDFILLALAIWLVLRAVPAAVALRWRADR